MSVSAPMKYNRPRLSSTPYMHDLTRFINKEPRESRKSRIRSDQAIAEDKDNRLMCSQQHMECLLLLHTASGTRAIGRPQQHHTDGVSWNGNEINLLAVGHGTLHQKVDWGFAGHKCKTHLLLEAPDFSRLHLQLGFPSHVPAVNRNVAPF